MLITGGSRGLGLELAREFGRRGAQVAIAGRDGSTVDRALADLRARGIDAHGIVADVRESADVKRMVAAATERFGSFDFNAAYTEVLTHTIQLYADNPVDDELKDWYNYVIPRNKASYSATWSIAQWAATLHGARTGGLPNYQGTARLAATTVYNATISFRLNNRASASLIADNVFDKQPQRDSTWTSYPYYATSWFNALGRQFFVQASYRFGGRD